MRHIAIIGAGPAGYYTAEAAVRLWGGAVRVDILDRLPVPYGLIRTGVAPDHQSIKGVARRFEKTSLAENVRFVGNVAVGRDVAVGELIDLYDAVVLATGAPRDRPLDIPGCDLANVFGSAAFVGWYNGHPQFADLAPDLAGKRAIVVGMGNVALDVTRILAKNAGELAGSDLVDHAFTALRAAAIRSITLIGRRGPGQIMMTPKELGELLELERAAPFVDAADLPSENEDAALDPGLRKSLGLLRRFAGSSREKAEEKPVRIDFDFFANPIAFHGDGKVQEVEIAETHLVEGRAEPTGRTYRLPADLVVTCIGYRTAPIAGVPFDERAGRFANERGRIAPALYCVGWARRGPTGTIGTNRPDGFEMIDRIAQDIGSGAGKAGPTGLDRLVRDRSLDVVSFSDWKRIEEAEEAAARSGAPREKFVDIEAMIRARD